MPNHLPLATGPFVPGMIDVMLDYKKESPFVRLYYPTQEKLNIKGSQYLKVCMLICMGFPMASLMAMHHPEQSDKWITWMPDETYLEGISKVLMLYKILLKLAFWWSAIYGAKPKTDEPLKCVVMSHGLGGCRFLYTNICGELASRGFLVAALEHRDHSACNTFYYASKVDAEKDKRSTLEFRHIKLGKDHYARRNDQLKTKSKECSEVLDFLLELQNGVVPHNVMDDVPVHKNADIAFNLSQLVGKLDLDSFTMMGHSFGAATALYTLSTRPEFKLGILLDPWMFPVKNEELDSKVVQPLLFINTQTFHIATNVQAMSKLVKTEGTQTKMYTVKHTTHENQTDSVLLIGYWLNWFMKKLDPLVALKINNSLILRFLNQYMNYPKNISDCHSLLEKEKGNIDEGLTKPWA